MLSRRVAPIYYLCRAWWIFHHNHYPSWSLGAKSSRRGRAASSRNQSPAANLKLRFVLKENMSLFLRGIISASMCIPRSWAITRLLRRLALFHAGPRLRVCDDLRNPFSNLARTADRHAVVETSRIHATMQIPSHKWRGSPRHFLLFLRFYSLKLRNN